MTNPAMHRAWLPRLTASVALLCALGSGVVYGLRGISVWRAAHILPGTTVTSGCEEESLFAVWRAVHGQPVYVDGTRLPYASAYFNWLFYAAYAGPVKLAVRARGDAIIPLAGRLITAGGVLGGAGLLFWLLWRTRAGSPAVAAGVAAFVFFGPLVGWWAHSVRPDGWALALETAALAVLLTGYRRHPAAAVLVAALLFYAAWGFKQTYFLGLGAALLFLLARRQWRPAVFLTGTSLALWIATFALLDPAYRAAFRDAGAAGIFRFAAGWDNFADMLKKTFPLWMLAAATLFRREEKTSVSVLAQDVRLLGWLGLLVAMPLAFVAGCKVGAYSNYYFTPLLMLAFVSVGITAAGRTGLLVPAAFAAALTLQVLIATGRVGQIDLRPQAREHAAIWAVWQKQPEPRFAAATNFNEPWLNPGSPPLVLAFNYWLKREAGRDFEAGGIGGLITAGRLRALLLPAGTGADYDGSPLLLYSRGETVNGLTVFLRDGHPPVQPGQRSTDGR